MELIDEISIVFPCDTNRVPLFLNTLAKYQEFGIPKKVEIIIVSRTFTELVIPGVDIKVVHYKHDGEFFCPSLAFNLGVKAAKYKNIIVGHPEVKPLNDVLSLLFKSKRRNYVCRVLDLNENGERTGVLFGTGHREEWIGLYFLACYKREDIEAINGWDMRFMDGYANEDIDFGQRLLNAKKPCIIRDDIMGEHQWHSRKVYEGSTKEWQFNRDLFNENKTNCVGYVENGLKEC